MTTPDPLLPPAENEDFEVAMAIVPSGRTVTWEPGTWEPDRVLWLKEGEWHWLADHSSRLKQLDIYETNRIDQSLCRDLLAELQRRASPTPSPTGRPVLPAAMAILAECIESPGTEIMIEGP